MKRILIVLAVFFVSLSVKAQDFKEVKTAQDVIDNHVTANGGADNLAKVKSIEMKGTIGIMGGTFPVHIYVSEDYFYTGVETPQMPVRIAISYKDKKGWQNLMGKVMDETPEAIEKNKERVHAMLWGYYLEKDKHGVTYNLLQNEPVGGNDAYVVEFIQNEKPLQTVYFDVKSFQRVMQIKGQVTSEYSDFRDVDASGIYMSYLITGTQGDVNVTEYKFNTTFDTKLLEKPKEE